MISLSPASLSAAPAEDEEANVPAVEDASSGGATDTEGPKPWEVGVTPESRATALKLFRQGNELFAESKHKDAAKSYRDALAAWDHPRIHGNLVTALIYLDDPLRANQHLKQALKYGARPFAAHVHEQLVVSRKLLAGQLARVTIHCERRGVSVTIDGKDVLECPGSRIVSVIAGRHQVVGRKPGHVTFTDELTTIGGDSSSVQVELVPLAEAVRYERRWSTWKPWAVVGAGVAIAALGIPLRRASLSARNQYEREIDVNCPSGCETAEISNAIDDLRGRSKTFNRLEIGAYALGATVAMAGGILAYLNRERRIEVQESGEILSATALISQDLLGAAVHIAF